MVMKNKSGQESIGAMGETGAIGGKGVIRVRRGSSGEITAADWSLIYF